MDENKTKILTSPAPQEDQLTPPGSWEMMLWIDVEGTRYDGDIAGLCKDHLKGCSQVEVERIYYKWNAVNDKQYLYMGFSAMGSTASAKILGGKKNGRRLVVSTMTVGAEYEGDLVPEGSWSRRIQPISSNLPMLRICIDKSETSLLTLGLFLRGFGPIQHHYTLKV